MLRPQKADHLLMEKFLSTMVALGIHKLVDFDDSPPSSQSSLPNSPMMSSCLPPLPLASSAAAGASSPASPSITEVLASRKRLRTPSSSNIDENIVGFGGEKSRTHVVSAEPPAKASRTSKTASRPKAPAVSSKAPSSPQVSSKMKRCQKCNLDIHRQSWSRHVRSHGDEKISCDLCGQDFTRLDHLKRHRVKHCHR